MSQPPVRGIFVAAELTRARAEWRSYFPPHHLEHSRSSPLLPIADDGSCDTIETSKPVLPSRVLSYSTSLRVSSRPSSNLGKNPAKPPAESGPIACPPTRARDGHASFAGPPGSAVGPARLPASPRARRWWRGLRGNGVAGHVMSHRICWPGPRSVNRTKT